MPLPSVFEVATDALFRELANFITPPRAGKVTAVESSGQVRVATDDPDGGDVLAWPLNGFTYAKDDVVYVLLALNNPESGIVVGSKGSVPVLDAEALPEAYLPADGSDPLTGDWDIGSGRKIQLARMDARDGNGIAFYDDGGNLVLFLEDGGKVGIGQSNPTVPLHVLVQAISNTRETFAKFQTSDAGDAALFFFNQTSANGGLMPCIGGLADDAARPSLDFGGYVTSALDSGSAAIVRFNANKTSDGSDPPNGTLSAPATRPLFAWASNGSVLMQMLANGDLGLGVTAAQGRFHVHDGVSGKLFVTKTSVGASAQTIIPNGTGDVTSLVRGTYILNDGSSATSGTVSLSQAGTTTLDISLGGSTWRVTLNANGALSVARTVGSATADITFDLVWQ